MAILSHHDLLAIDDIDAGGKALEALGVFAHQLSREGEDVAGLAAEEGLGGDALNGCGGRDGQLSVGARADEHVHHQGLVLLLVLQELVALGEDLFRRPSPHLADEGCVLTVAGGQRCKRMDK